MRGCANWTKKGCANKSPLNHTCNFRRKAPPTRRERVNPEKTKKQKNKTPTFIPVGRREAAALSSWRFRRNFTRTLDPWNVPLMLFELKTTTKINFGHFERLAAFQKQFFTTFCDVLLDLNVGELLILNTLFYNFTHDARN